MSESFVINGKPIREMGDAELAHFVADCNTRLGNSKGLLAKVLTDIENISCVLAVLLFEQERRAKSLVIAHTLPP